MSLTAPELLRFLLQFAALLSVSRLLGEAARRLGQPQVIGELLAGIIIGPSLFGALLPSLYGRLFPPTGAQGLLLQLISQVGVILLLLLSGMEIQLSVVQRNIRQTVVVALFGIAVSFAGGYGLAVALPRSMAGPGAQHVAFVLFVATAMSMSALPVIVKILIDLDLIRRQVGQLILAAGIITDILGWFLLSCVTGIAASGLLSVKPLLIAIGGTVLFALFAFTLGFRLIRAALGWIAKRFGGESPILSAVIVTGLIGAAATQSLRMEAFLGAFLTGIQLARLPHVRREVFSQLRGMTLAVFSPIFFATAGLKVDLTQLLSLPLLGILLAVIAVATASKLVGSYIGARIAGFGHWMAVALGGGLNGRGAVEIIVATIGLQIGVLSVPMYSIIVVMAVVTSMMAPPLLKWSLKHTGAEDKLAPRLIDFIGERSILTGLTASSKEEAIGKLVDLLIRTRRLSVDRETLLASVLKREAEASTCIGHGLAIPHAVLPDGEVLLGVMGLSATGLALETPDGEPVRCMVLLATPESQRAKHLEVMAALASIGRYDNVREKLFSAESSAHAYEILHSDEAAEFNYIVVD